VDDNGAEVKGAATAENEDQLSVILRRQGQYLVRVAMASDAGSGVAGIRLFEGMKRRDVIFFTNQLATVMATGVGLVEGLQDIESQARKQGTRRVVAALRRDIESGASLSTALARHPKVFTDLYVNIVKAGEATGQMERALGDLTVQLEWQEDITSRIREVATYPALVIVMLAVLMVVLVGFTIPRFISVYERLNAEIVLPLPTRIVMTASAILRGYWPVIVTALAAAFVAVKLYAQTPGGAIHIARTALRIPVVGELLRKIALSRFAHYFASLHESGLEVAPSLSLVEKLIGNAYLSHQFNRAVQRVMAGESLAHALRSVGEFPPVVIQMFALGEKTGRMAKALQDVRRYFDGEVDRTIKRSLTLFGPILLVVLASTFVLMALAFYLPLFQLLRGIQ
jgi:type IV pilus assembly protein PilC